MINNLVALILCSAFLLHDATDLRANFQLEKEVQNCEQIKKQTHLYWHFTDTPKSINYALYFNYLYCKYSLGEVHDVQGYSIFGMFSTIDSIEVAEYDINKHQSLLTINVEDEQLEHIDSFIVQNAQHRVIIYNDDHSRMETRAFFMSKLALYKQLGFTHLAMEAFQDVSQTVPSFALGYYFQEPIMAEIYREAKRLGYTFIPYEAFEDDRMETQAKQLYSQIQTLKPNEKVLVFSGELNMAEDLPEGVRLFGVFLKK